MLVRDLPRPASQAGAAVDRDGRPLPSRPAPTEAETGAASSRNSPSIDATANERIEGLFNAKAQGVGGRTESHPTNRASTISRMADLRDGQDSLGEHATTRRT